MIDSPLVEQIYSLPGLIATSSTKLAHGSADIARKVGKNGLSQIILTGCGDSHHAAVATRLAFQQLTAVPTYALTAMEVSRYQAEQLKLKKDELSLIVAISSSGQVSRTIEALAMAKISGAITVGVTANKESELARIADFVLPVVDEFMTPGEVDVVVPGARSYYLSLLALYHFADQLTLYYRKKSAESNTTFFTQAESISDLARRTIQTANQKITSISNSWRDANRFVLCGSGPNYGTAMYSAAKIIEASGDPAVAQDLEEWAHLQYFEREEDTPTIIISAGNFDLERALEVVEAAKTIGRRIAVIGPKIDRFVEAAGAENLVSFAESIREAWSPLLTALPGLLFAAHRSTQQNEPYFRDFAGGRSRSGGGGISRSRTSHRIDQQIT